MKRFITSADISDLLRKGLKELRLDAEDQMTDLARELVRQRGIRVARAEPISAAAANVSNLSDFPGSIRFPEKSISPTAGGEVSPAIPMSAPAGMIRSSSREFDLTVQGGIVVLPEVGRVPLNVCVKDGKIAALTTDCPPAGQTISAVGKYVLPGIIDPHTHLGLYAPLETDLETESRSALLGGVTTIGAFFNHTGSYLPTISMLEQTIPRYSRIDVIPHFTLRDMEQIQELPLYSAQGMNSFKVYMCGVKGLYPHQEDGFILKAMETLRELPADPVLCIHAENTSIVDYATEDMEGRPVSDLTAWGKTHPNIAEGEAVVRSAYLGNQTGIRTYIVHNSSKESMAVLRKVKQDRLYAETTSPYLTLDTSSDVGAYGKMLPPFREPESRLALWQGIRDGLIDTIGTDNVTMTSAEKKAKQGMESADPGYPALATHMPSVLEEGFFRQEIPLEKLVPLMTMNPAKIFGVYPHKGTLLPGADADIVIVDLEHPRLVDHTALLSRSDFSLFQGRMLRGWPVYTIKGGRIAVAEGRLADDSSRGAMLRHGCI